MREVDLSIYKVGHDHCICREPFGGPSDVVRRRFFLARSMPV